MHASAMRIAGKFLSAYHTRSAAKILEVGSMDVNGSLRRLQPVGSTWTGVDIEDGPGVDVVVPIHSPLPFPDNCFDLVLASSVFEHDTAFWVTLEEMARVVKPTGFIYISAPSNGMVHRYPLDVFRFYPDASIAFLEIVRKRKGDACLAESFVASQDLGSFGMILFALLEDPAKYLSRAHLLVKARSALTSGGRELLLMRATTLIQRIK